MGPPWRIDPTTHRTMNKHSYHGAAFAPCLDDVMNLANGLLCSDCDWPSPTGGRLPDYHCHVWIQHPSSSPCCMKGHSPLVWPPCLHGSPWEGRKEGNVLFNYALFYYLRLYGVKYMVKDHSDSEKGNPLPPYRLLVPINSNVSFICIIPQIG